MGFHDSAGRRRRILLGKARPLFSSSHLPGSLRLPPACGAGAALLLGPAAACRVSSAAAGGKLCSVWCQEPCLFVCGSLAIFMWM